MTRDAASEGVALGAVSLPWALAGALAWALRHGPPGLAAHFRLVFRASAAGSAAWLAALAWRAAEMIAAEDR